MWFPRRPHHGSSCVFTLKYCIASQEIGRYALVGREPQIYRVFSLFLFIALLVFRVSSMLPFSLIPAIEQSPVASNSSFHRVFPLRSFGYLFLFDIPFHPCLRSVVGFTGIFTTRGRQALNPLDTLWILEIFWVYPIDHSWPRLAMVSLVWLNMAEVRFRSPGMPTLLTHGAWWCDMVLMTVRLSFVAPRAWWTTSWETPGFFNYIHV